MCPKRDVDDDTDHDKIGKNIDSTEHSQHSTLFQIVACFEFIATKTSQSYVSFLSLS